ncbi:uncharacterized protein LOC132306327 isoform X2 [Cornus florida]|uniref:uncharacterized protein LOC132306327 isoform X2 n=1 Tax=Cornus florida TaxID=4283 RepID=UPI0028A2C53D|nr:uncharacterized protein LOC132306327 isoform X2 [Cornus florida]
MLMRPSLFLNGWYRIHRIRIFNCPLLSSTCPNSTTPKASRRGSLSRTSHQTTVSADSKSSRRKKALQLLGFRLVMGLQMMERVVASVLKDILGNLQKCLQMICLMKVVPTMIGKLSLFVLQMNYFLLNACQEFQNSHWRRPKLKHIKGVEGEHSHIGNMACIVTSRLMSLMLMTEKMEFCAIVMKETQKLEKQNMVQFMFLLWMTYHQVRGQLTWKSS